MTEFDIWRSPLRLECAFLLILGVGVCGLANSACFLHVDNCGASNSGATIVEQDHTLWSCQVPTPQITICKALYGSLQHGMGVACELKRTS